MSLYISDALGCSYAQLTPYFRQIDDLERQAQQNGQTDKISVIGRLSFKINRMEDVIYMYDYCPNSELHRIREVFQNMLQEITATA
jgi:hypothetical protein